MPFPSYSPVQQWVLENSNVRCRKRREIFLSWDPGSSDFDTSVGGVYWSNTFSILIGRIRHIRMTNHELIHRICISYSSFKGFPGGSVVKNPPTNAGDASLIPGLRRFPGVGNGNPLPYFRLENPMDRGTWQATVNEGPKSQTQLSLHKHGFYLTDLSSESP